MSTRTVNTQHGQSIILPPQKVDRSSCSAWACGMLTKELLQNRMMMVSSRLFDVNWTENEQDWSSVQFISTATVLSVKIFLSNIYI